MAKTEPSRRWTFEERGPETLVVIHDLYPSKEALDAAIASGSTGGFSETFEQLDEILVNLARPVCEPVAPRMTRMMRRCCSSC